MNETSDYRPYGGDPNNFTPMKMKKQYDPKKLTTKMIRNQKHNMLNNGIRPIVIKGKEYYLITKEGLKGNER